MVKPKNQDKKLVGLADKLGALAYHEKHAGKDVKPFEQLTEAEQAPFVEEAVKFIVRLDKLNMSVGDKAVVVDPKQISAREEQLLDQAEGLIRGFVKGLKNTKPDLFPCRELAAQIMAGPGKPR